MRQDAIPPEEALRLAAVRRYDILDTPPDGAFDRVAALAARVIGTPISTITIVDEDRIWFKSAFGLAGVEQLDRDPGLCASAILESRPYVITDAATDPRSLANPLVRGELGLRFYAAVPLRTTDGYNLGTLNVIDRVPRGISEDELATLEDLAAIVMDELELRLAARKAIELETLRTAAEFRDTIVAGLSHEMRTPIGVLQGILELPSEQFLDPERAEALQLACRRQLDHLSRLVEQFLDFASLESGSALSVRPEPTPLGRLLSDAVELHADRVGIDVDLPEGLPDALIDPERTMQVVTELLTNAVRFGPRGGSVAVRVEHARPDELHLTVIDEGPGVEPRALPHLFEKYYRSPGSTGSGLGLYVAQAIARAQGGRIEVGTRPGSGGRFTLVVPVAEAGTG